MKTIVALSNTQSAVIYLCNMLPKATYNVFTDNLFSSPNLFRAFRKAGHGVIVIARLNYGISKELKEAKGSDKAGAGPLQYNQVRAVPTVNGLKNNSLVLFLSSMHTGADKEYTKRRKPANKDA
ncbi:hypothetical protein FOYG_17131 [Fusarium oxysporum NRRL 32931]|uniref:PiggyBac transposable element-derived protein domain-containing protein n=1 Tax=Fusarium oxysporum NRRL 32931 TaxID=660029 RepID=W9HHR4_FUSOX|nr:hypothetical protein FOYG_17131 [Fusarium oxysporum NRRL 32931]